MKTIALKDVEKEIVVGMHRAKMRSIHIAIEL